MGNCLCPGAAPEEDAKAGLENELGGVRATMEEGVPRESAPAPLSPEESAAKAGDEAEAKVKAQAEAEAKAQQEAAEAAAKAQEELAAAEEEALEAKHKAEEAALAAQATVSQPKEIKEHLKKAKKKFDALDADDSGALETEEIKKLAEWVFAQFHDDGEKMSEQQQDSEMAKLMELDTNKDGKLDFEEFGDWFNDTAKAIFQHNHEKRWLQREAEKKAAAEKRAEERAKAAEEKEAAEKARAEEAAAAAEEAAAEAKKAAEAKEYTRLREVDLAKAVPFKLGQDEDASSLPFTLPSSLDDVDAAWMDKLLRHRGLVAGKAKVLSIEKKDVGLTAGYFSSISFVTCTYSDDVPEDTPKKFVVKAWPQVRPPPS